MGSELVKWHDSAGNDTLLSLSHLTVGIEQKFVAYAKMKMLEGAKELMFGQDLQEYRSYIVSGKEFWNEGGMTNGVASLFQSEEGTKHLVKLLFGDSIKGMTTNDFNDLYDTMQDEKSSLYEAYTLVIKKRFPEVEEYLAEKKSVTDPVTPDQPATVSSSPS